MLPAQQRSWCVTDSLVFSACLPSSPPALSPPDPFSTALPPSCLLSPRWARTIHSSVDGHLHSLPCTGSYRDCDGADTCTSALCICVGQSGIADTFTKCTVLSMCTLLPCPHLLVQPNSHNSPRNVSKSAPLHARGFSISGVLVPMVRDTGLGSQFQTPLPRYK